MSFAEELRELATRDDSVEVTTALAGIKELCRKRAKRGERCAEFPALTLTVDQRKAVIRLLEGEGIEVKEHRVTPSDDPREHDWTELKW